MSLNEQVDALFESQLKEWPQAAANYAALADVKVKDFDIDGIRFKVQFNPARAVSSGAKVDAQSIKARKCFLCAENRPEVQRGIVWGDNESDPYTILVNPFPIFPRHLTIPDVNHVPQAVTGSVVDMLRLANDLEGYTVFYNGAKCGASAPDHFHFQAGNSDFLPLADNLDGVEMKEVLATDKGTIYLVDSLPIKMFVIDSATPQEGNLLSMALFNHLPADPEGFEPMLNLLAYAIPTGTRLVVIPRKRHRPSFYGTEGDDCMMISPASVDLGGVFITPRLVDYERIDAGIIRRTIDEVCLSADEINAIAEKVAQIDFL